MSKVDPSEQREAALSLEWIQYCTSERLGQYQPLGFEAWKEKYYGKEVDSRRD